MPRTEVWAGARRKAAPGKAAFRRPSRRSIKVWICRYERAPLTIARIENRITPACPYIFPSARRRSGMVARQVRRSVVIRNLRVGLLAMDSDRLPLRKRKDVLHGAVRAVPLRQSVEQPWEVTMEVLHPGCAGLDIHKDSVVTCVRIAEGGRVMRHVQTFATTTADLERLSAWLKSHGVTHV